MLVLLDDAIFMELVGPPGPLVHDYALIVIADDRMRVTRFSIEEGNDAHVQMQH